MGLYRAEGIVLANRDLGEADRIVNLFCREQGRIEAVARGARRPRNRLVGLTLPFNVLRVAIFAGRGLEELSQAESVRSFQSLRGDLILLAYASYLTELAAEFLPAREPSPPAFDLLLGALIGLEAGEEPDGLSQFFALRLLEIAGFRPALEACLGCGEIPGPEEAVAFSPRDGGFFCRHCQESRTEIPFWLSPATRESLLSGQGGDRFFLERLSPSDRQTACLAIHRFLEAHLERELRSYRFLTGLLSDPGLRL